MTFSDIIGQDTALWCARGLLRQGRAAHALLFHGPDGCGKRTLARAYAAALNCERPSDGACGACDSCKRIARDVDVDVQVFYPNKGEYAVDQVREIRAQAFLTPNARPWKVLILDDVDCLSRESGNRLLKVIEEPPGTTVFILLTAALDRVLMTIRSRSLPVPFRPLAAEETARVIGGRAPADAIEFLYGVTRGNVGAMLALAEDDTLRKLFEDVRELTASHLVQASMVSPTWLADRIGALGDKFPVEGPGAPGVEETKASRSRRGALAVLDVVVTQLRGRMLESVAGGDVPGAGRMGRRIEAVLETVRDISGMGNQVLAVEGLALRLAAINAGA